MDKVRIGVIGIGNMGSSHSRNIFAGEVPGAELPFPHIYGPLNADAVV